MQIRLASTLQKDSVVDGEGIRTVVWTQGCPHNCPGCHNPSTHAFDEGFLVDIDEIKKELNELEGQDGITLSGGDPLLQSKASLEIAKHAKSIGLSVWCYTGYVFEDIINNPSQKALLDYVDVLVDGPFILEKRSLNCTFRGSTNQRIIDVKKSLEKEQVVTIDIYDIKINETQLKKEEYIFI